jgi:two-component system, sensor histidine kinase LadS
MQLSKLFFIIFLLPVILFSNEIIVDGGTVKQEILSSSKIYIDKSSSLDINQVKKQKFQENKKEILSYGLSPDFTVWIQFKLINMTNQQLQKVIEYGNPLSTDIVFYDEKHVIQDGLYHLADRTSLNPNFKIKLQPYETKTYYIKSSSNITTLIIKLNLYDPKTFQTENEIHKMVLAMFFASMLILVVYNLVIYFFTKDKNYLLYVIYMSTVIFHQLLYSGFGSIYLFSNQSIIFAIKYSAVVVALPIFIFALLVRSFLKTVQYPIVDKILVYYLYIFPFTIISFFIFDGIALFRNFSSLILMLLLLGITIYASFKKNRQAYFVLVGWFVMILAFIFMYLSSIGLWEIFSQFKYFVEIALLLEGVIFSIALADKINQLEYKKNEVSMELVLQKEIETLRLAHQVEQKTKELQNTLDEKNTLLKELNHRVKNNMQTIVSLIRLQSDKYEDIHTVELLQTIQNRINAMGCLHELLYQQDDISHIDTKKYFELLISELQEGFESEKIRIRYQIDVDLPSHTAVYCGLIINELVTNAFKYAFKQNDGEIQIILKKENAQFYLQVSDNGKGYIEKDGKENLGSLLVQTLATKQLKGEIKKNTSNGVKVEIIWS